MNTHTAMLYPLLMVAAVICPPPAFSDPEAAHYSSSTGVLSAPFLKVDGLLLYKNAQFYLDTTPGRYEIRALEEVLPNDIIHIDTAISLAEGSSSNIVFQGFVNVPILVTTERQEGSLGYSIQFFDSSGFLRAQRSTQRGNYAPSRMAPGSGCQSQGLITPPARPRVHKGPHLHTLRRMGTSRRRLSWPTRTIGRTTWPATDV
jgi:hypothetical protein